MQVDAKLNATAFKKGKFNPNANSKVEAQFKSKQHSKEGEVIEQVQSTNVPWKQYYSSSCEQHVCIRDWKPSWRHAKQFELDDQSEWNWQADFVPW